MNKRILNYVNKIYKGVFLTNEDKLEKQELYENLIEKYEDLKDSGNSDKESVDQVIKDLGDVSDVRKRLGLMSTTDVYWYLLLGNVIYFLFLSISILLYMRNVFPVTVQDQVYYYQDPLTTPVMWLMIFLILTLIVPFIMQLYITWRLMVNKVSENLKLLTIIVGAFTLGSISGILVLIAGIKMKVKV